MLVLCGSFQSFDAGGAEACIAVLSEGFARLAALLGRYSYLKVCRAVGRSWWSVVSFVVESWCCHDA